MFFTALLGNPVDHSVSNYLFAQYADYIGLEYAHLKLTVPTEQDLPDFLASLQRLGCLGVNITIPYKLSVIPYLDVIDKKAQAIGAVNTVVMANNQLIGYNTDGMGAGRAIATYLRTVKGGDRLTFLGAGGAARAIIYELSKKTDNITIFAPIQEELTKLVNDFDSGDKKPLQTYLLDENKLFDCLTTTDFLINATPVGMYPHGQESLISEEMVKELSRSRNLKNLLAFDAIFNPHTTKMLQILANYGSPICSGIWMMIYQAVFAFQLWTGKDVSGANFPEIEAKLTKLLYEFYT